MRWLLLFCLAAMSALLSALAYAQDAVPVSQNSIWFEQRVGHVTIVAQRSKGVMEASLAYGFYLTAIGPRPATANKEFGSCLKEAVREAGLSLFSALDSEVSLFVPEVEPLYSDTQVARTQNALITARGDYTRAVVNGCKSIGQTDALKAYVDGTRLALIKRECTAALCPGLDVPQRARVFGAISEGERRERVFEAIYYWSLKRGLDTALNQPLLLDFSDSGGLAPRIADLQPGVNWPERLNADTVQSLFEAGVARVIADPAIPPLSSVVAAQIALPQRTALRTALAFRNPRDAYDLSANVAEFKLSTLQDEVARIRLTECKVYRGMPDVASVAHCAGYELDNNAMLECLNNGPCMPKIAEFADAGAILQSARRRVSELGTDSFVPRPFSDAVGSFGAMVNTYKACTTDGDATAAAACLARKSIPTEIAVQANCLLDNASANRIGCLVPDNAGGRALKQLQQCVERKSVGCAIAAALPPEWACIASAKVEADLRCLPASLGGDRARVARCLAQESNTTARIVCIGGDQIPKPVRQVVECYSSARTEAGAAICVAGAALPPEQAAVVKCVAESGGDPMAAGVCVAAPLLKLNPGQQILLQCAASSGGVPATAAACVVGRFTLNELQGCRTADFGQSGCFGDGNEFQRLAKSITGSDISKDSVVGQIVIAHVQVVNAAVGGIGHALNEFSKGGENTIEGLNHEMEKIRTTPLDALADAPGNIVREGGKGLENAWHAINPADWRL